MLSLKFSATFLIFFLLAQETFSFTDNQCLKENFKTEISHKGSPFGLFKRTLRVNKQDCVLEVAHKKLKFFKRKWMVDVCRKPIHIKRTEGAVKVLKKSAPCNKEKNNDFCTEASVLKTLLQDDGLIFAQGEKEKLESDHGKIYCAYLLINAYLDRGNCFFQIAGVPKYFGKRYGKK